MLTKSASSDFFFFLTRLRGLTKRPVRLHPTSAESGTRDTFSSPILDGGVAQKSSELPEN